MAEVPWQADAAEWIDSCLARHGIDRTGAVEAERVRPWGTVLRAPTSAGPVWLKAPVGATRFEVPLYGLLSVRVPERVLEPLGADLERGWVLLPDGGLPAGERFQPEQQTTVLEQALPVYAELQLRLMDDVPAMLDLGVADMRPPAMPNRFRQALLEIGPVPVGADEGGRAGRAAIERVRAMEPEYCEWCRQLASSPIPASLDHNDLHSWNVIAGAGGGFTDARFYDWGDAVVAHPFASLLAVGFLRGIDTATAERLRDAYLEPFAAFAPHTDLVRDVELACRVGKVARALSWRRALGPDPDPRWAEGPAVALTSLLDDGWTGSA